MSCESRKRSSPPKGLPLSEVQRLQGKKREGGGAFGKRGGSRKKVDGDNRPTIGGTPIAEGGERQATGGSIELGRKLAHEGSQPQKKGVQRSLEEFNEITSIWDRTAHTRTGKHK